MHSDEMNGGAGALLHTNELDGPDGLATKNPLNIKSIPYEF